MIGIFAALAFGLAAGLFAPVAAFAVALLLGLGAFAAARYGETTLGSVLLEAVILMVVAQLGYATSVFLRAILLRAKREAVAAEPQRADAAAGENLRGMSD